MDILFIALSAAIIFMLGLAHLIYTFFGVKLLPRDDGVRLAMTQTHLHITRQTTLWRAWIGFNASHSLGALLFGLVYSYLAVMQSALLFDSYFFIGLGLLVLSSYWLLAKTYWFKVPFWGVSLALLFFVAGFIANTMA